MRYAVLVTVLILAVAAAAQQQAERGYCRNVRAVVQHGDALGRACEFASSLQKKLPDVICQRTLKSYGGRSRVQVVTAEVRHQNGRDTYSKVTLDGKPFPASTSHLPGSWSEGEFGSVLQFLFADEFYTQFKFEKETHFRSHAALLFEFQLAAENNHGWYVEANGWKVYPGFKGRLWLDSSSNAVLRVEMEAEHLEEAAHSSSSSASVILGPNKVPERRVRFPLQSVRVSIDYTNEHLGDGTDFVLPTSSEDRKCLVLGPCIRDELTFENCHKFGATSRILDDVTK